MSKQPSRIGKEKKSKDVKGKPISTEKLPTTLFEIVPGKFNENDWNTILDIDESQDFIWELIDEVFDNSIKIIYDKYIESQTIPFTINEAKKAILHIIDWQFLTKDNDDSENSWEEDQEPESCVIDSWAQGYVQSVVAVSQEFLKESKTDEYVEEQVEEEKINFLEDLDNFVATTAATNDSTVKKSLNATSQSSLVEKSHKTSIKTDNKEKPKIIYPVPKLKKTDFKLSNSDLMFGSEIEPKPTVRRAKFVDPEAKKIETSISKAPPACQSVLKTLLNRPTGFREVDIDQFGNICSLVKLDMDKLPSNSVKARFSICDTSRQETGHDIGKKSKASKTDLDTKSDKQPIDKSAKNLRRLSPPRRTLRKSASEEESELILEPAPGVVLTIQNSTRAGPKKMSIPLKHQSILEKSEEYLRPIRTIEKSDLITRLTIDQILENVNQLSIIKNSRKPIPPISQSSTPHTQLV